MGRRADPWEMDVCSEIQGQDIQIYQCIRGVKKGSHYGLENGKVTAIDMPCIAAYDWLHHDDDG